MTTFFFANSLGTIALPGNLRPRPADLATPRARIANLYSDTDS